MRDDFRLIPGFVGYRVNSEGVLLGKKSGRPLRVHEDRYVGTTLRCPDFKRVYVTVHRLVALAFLPRVCGKNQVNHKNGNTYDNRVENLEWCTAKENTEHAICKLGNRRDGRHNPRAILNEKKVRKIKRLLSHGKGTCEIGQRFGVSGEVICHIASGRTWKNVRLKKSRAQ